MTLIHLRPTGLGTVGRPATDRAVRQTADPRPGHVRSIARASSSRVAPLVLSLGSRSRSATSPMYAGTLLHCHHSLRDGDARNAQWRTSYSARSISSVHATASHRDSRSHPALLRIGENPLPPGHCKAQHQIRTHCIRDVPRSALAKSRRTG